MGKPKVFPKDCEKLGEKKGQARRAIDLNKEHFWCVGLANNSKLLYIELVSLGTLSQSIVEIAGLSKEEIEKFA